MKSNLFFSPLLSSTSSDVTLKRILVSISNLHNCFSPIKMIKVLDILEDFMRYRRYPFERLDGAIKKDLRQAAIDRFCDLEADSFAFLMSTRAGGLGLNLTQADTGM